MLASTLSFRNQVPETENILQSVAVHQALCHPTILSLFSTFSAADSDVEGDRQPQTQSQGVPNAGTRYIVLEHCGPHGALSDHLSRLTNFASTFPLGVDRIRGVVKTLADALAYLEKENVVHRRLVPESVYITEDFRAVSVDLSLVFVDVGLSSGVVETWRIRQCD